MEKENKSQSERFSAMKEVPLIDVYSFTMEVAYLTEQFENDLRDMWKNQEILNCAFVWLADKPCYISISTTNDPDVIVEKINRLQKRSN